MSDKKQYVRVESSQGENVRRILLNENLLDIDYRIISQDQLLYFPLVEGTEKDLISSIMDAYEFKVGQMLFEPASSGPRTLEDALSEYLNETELALLPRAYDLVGDIAVLEIPDELIPHQKRIGSGFQQVHPHFNTVLAKLGAITGTTRTRDYVLLAGEDKTSTIHIEYGCRIAVDLAKAYFSPRLLEEHNRVAKQVQSGEYIVDMFTGVGPFALHIAKHCDIRITAIDINPDAISLLQQSMSLNKLVGVIEPVVGDASEYTISIPNGSVDRVIMNHPSGASEFVSSACRILRSSGILHYYDFVGGDEPHQTLCDRITKLIEGSEREVIEIVKTRRVRDSAPFEYQMVADVLIE